MLLCIGSTALGGEKLQTALRYNDRTWKKWLGFVKLYLSMEEWFHHSNPKEEVNNTRPLIAKVLQLLQDLFPRTTISQDGNRVIYHANPHIQGRMWYDWAYVHFEEVVANEDTVERFYPAKVLGFIKYDEKT